MSKLYLALTASLALTSGPAMADVYQSTIVYPDTDTKIIENHALNSLTQLKLSQQAETRARTRVVRNLADRIQQENSNNLPLAQAASEKGFALPTVLDSQRQDVVEKLSHAPKFIYDEGYLMQLTRYQSEQLASLENILEMESALPGSMSAGLVSYAAEKLPQLRQDMSLTNYASYRAHAKHGKLTESDFLNPNQLASKAINFD